MTLSNDQRKVTITVQNADPDGSGNRRDHVFEMIAGGEEGLTIAPQLRTGTKAPGGETSQLLNTLFSEITGNNNLNQYVALDLGTGQMTWTLSFQGWEGATDLQGSPLQWGDTGNTGAVTKTDATGADPLTQMSVFFYVLYNTRVDSLPEQVGGTVASAGPAKLQFGQYHPNGVYDPLDVVFEDPGSDFRGADPSVFSGSITCIYAADLGKAADTDARTERGT
jgi:hypothetical protein